MYNKPWQNVNKSENSTNWLKRQATTTTEPLTGFPGLTSHKLCEVAFRERSNRLVQPQLHNMQYTS
jgi:hypothetical protein